MTVYRFVLFLFVWLMASAVPLMAQHQVEYRSGGVLSPAQAAFQVSFYDLDLTINPADSTVSGSVDAHFTMVHPSNVIELALDPRLEVHEVTMVGGEPLHFSHHPGDKRLMVHFPATVQPGTELAVRVAYGGQPRVAVNAPWDGGVVWEKTPSGDPWLGVAVQTIGAWVWWPNKDHPSDRPDSVAINLAFPDDLVVASNGRLRGTTPRDDGFTTWHWFHSLPISNYNVTFNAAPYEMLEESYISTAGEEVEMMFWVLPEYREQAEALFPQFSTQLRFLEELLGPYPFRTEKYGVAHSPYLGMEHQTIIAYGATFENDNLFGLDGGYDDLHQHELAHEWWGNLVTAWDWRDFWLHEGFGTYMQALYAEHLQGDESYRRFMELFKRRTVSRSPIAPRQSMDSVEISGAGRGGDVYYKGALFLHTLRYYLGDEPFFELLRRFAYPTPELETATDGRHMRYATTDDFLELANRMTDEDLSWLFEAYLREAQTPQLVIDYAEGETTLRWKTESGGPFHMPLELYVNGEMKFVSPIDGVITLDVSKDASIEVDPYSRVLMEVVDNRGPLND
ncbi:MAG: M1 family metallopeptidase [Balneolaceae bacterium]